jgi:drug/metabolite transporter (DMT)-like permease
MNQQKTFTGIALAILTVIIWSGNFIVARGVIKDFTPIQLAFLRWSTATIILLPIAFKSFWAERKLVLQHLRYFLFTALMGITLFNTFIYVAGRYSLAINLALIGTTSSPIMATILAAVFLKEKITFTRLLGLLICIAGILLLLSNGSLVNLINFRFTKGDWWVLAGAFSFAVYNVMVRKKPMPFKPLTFLFACFALGAIMLLPAFVIEQQISPRPVHWSNANIGIIAYLGLGTSVIGYLCWNEAINILGTARTAIFGNLIPIFSTIEAVLLLNEKIRPIHYISGLVVIAGLIIANIFNKPLKTKTIIT